MSLPNRIARLNSDGSQDTSFAVGTGLDDTGHCVALLKDGRLIVGGAFQQVGSTMRSRLAVINANGTVHAATLNTNWDVFSLAVQTDGKVIAAGRFTRMAGVDRNCLARLTQGLAVEPAFDPNANGTVRCLAMTTDGKVYAGGAFTHVGDRDRYRLVRLFNDLADSTLTVVNASLISWQRAGSLPETQRVVWQVDTGSGYGDLAGVTTRTPGGWQLVPTTPLSGAGDVRVLALPTDGRGSGVQQDVKSFNFAPEIAVEIGGVDTASGGTLAFGDVQAGTTKELQVTIRNVGLATLTISSVTLGGTAAARYSKTDPALSVPAQTATICTVRFTPTTLGAQPATLTIASDDGDEASFVINLLGTATPGPGGVDTSWQPSVTGVINALAVRPGELLVGGLVRSINAQARLNWGRVSLASAAVLSQSGAASDREVWGVLPLLEGRTLLLGSTATVTRLWLVKADGVTDTAFSVSVTGGVVRDVCLTPDGGVVVAGSFTRIGGLTRGGCAKLMPGTLRVDPTFDPVTAAYTSVLCAEDGSLWLGLGTVPTGGLPVIHLTSTGAVSLDQMAANTYLSNLNPTAVAADGGIYLTGWRDPDYANRLIKIAANGVEDTEFNRAWVAVSAPVVQVDGRLIVIGKAALSDSGVLRLRRLLAAGIDDASFTESAANRVDEAFVLDDAGKVYRETASGVARLLNSASANSLAVVSTARVTWTRSGALPEVSWVRLDLTEDGTNWQHLGLCTRMTGGWEKTGLNLPRNGRVRVQAYTGSGLITAEQTYANLPVPDLVIERSNVALAQGAIVSFAGRIAGGAQSSDVTLTLRNVGLADLTGLVAAVSASDFRVVSLGLPGQADPTTLAALQETQLVLRFTPTLTSARNGTLTITSNVPGAKGRVTLQLRGNGVTNPVATTQAATAITHVVAQLNAAFTANDDTATVSIEYKRSIDTNWISIALDPVTGFTATTRLANVGTLTASTAYQFRTKIVNSLSTQFGIVRTFTTSPPP